MTIPFEIFGIEQNLGQIPAHIYLPNILSIMLPNNDPMDIIAFAHGGTEFYSGKNGNGDRCPSQGVFDTSTHSFIVREPAVPINRVIEDSTGIDLLGWSLQTFGDQFRIVIAYKYPVDPLNLNFSGHIELDTDQDLNTGLVHTPFMIPYPFNEIPSWGWDVAIEYSGGAGIASDPHPFKLDFGVQSPFINFYDPTPPLDSSFPYFPFGNNYNDGRWYITGNNQLVVLEGSLSMLDAWQWLSTDAGVIVNRVSADGNMIGRLFTRAFGSISVTARDIIPKDNAFDFWTGIKVPAISWNPDTMVSGFSPANDHAPQYS